MPQKRPPGKGLRTEGHLPETGRNASLCGLQAVSGRLPTALRPSLRVKRPGHRLIGGLVAALCLAGLSIGAVGAASAVPDAADREALLARGIRLYTTGDLRTGVDLLRSVGEEHADWPAARRALGAALVRAGLDEEARAVYEALLGRDRALALAAGDFKADDLDASVEADDLLGLGMTYELRGEPRPAERLYRAFADHVGPTERDAARGYRRLAILFEELSVPWGDPAAERAKADAVDPRAAAGPGLPRFPAPEDDPSLAPYMRTIEPSTARAESLTTYDTPPWLVHWEPLSVEVVPSEPAGRLRDVAVEVRIDTTGVPHDATPVEAALSDTVASALASSLSAWRFAPARRDGRPVETWVVVTAKIPAAAPAGQGPPGAAPDTTDVAPPDEAGSPTNDTSDPERNGQP